MDLQYKQLSFGRRGSKSWLKACLAISLIVLILVLSFQFHRADDLKQPLKDRSHKIIYALAKQKAVLLDDRYVSKSKTSIGSSGAGTLNSHTDLHDNYDELNFTTAIVVGRLKNDTDKVRWIHNKLDGIDSSHIYIVDDPHTDLPHLNKNHGRESAVYLSYIIDNYNNLSDITFFWHPDEIVWHNNLLLKWSSVNAINHMSRQNIIRSGYVPARCDSWPGCPRWIRRSASMGENALDPHRLESMYSPELLSRLFGDNILDQLPPYFAGTCCSQFAVSRDAIRSQPIEIYQNILDWVLEYEDDNQSGMVLEYLWPYIFLRQGVLCPSMPECYCKSYNICINDKREIKQLETWNEFRSRREEVEYQVMFMENARDRQQEAAHRQGVSQREILEIESRFYPEIQRLSQDLKQLSDNAWQTQEEIIKAWNLGVPPVGW